MHAVWSQAALRYYSLCPHTELPEIHPFSITHYWLLIIMLIACLLVLLMCCIFSGVVKFSKDRVKIQIWAKPVIFSHELCLYEIQNDSHAQSLTQALGMKKASIYLGWASTTCWSVLENVEHCGGEPEHASWYRNIMSLVSDVTHQVKHPPTCTIHSPFTGGLKLKCFF